MSTYEWKICNEDSNAEKYESQKLKEKQNIPDMARLLKRRGLALLPTNGKRKNPAETWRGEGDVSDISGVVGMLYDT